MSKFNSVMTTDHKSLQLKDSGSRSLWKIQPGANVVMVDQPNFLRQKEFH